MRITLVSRSWPSHERSGVSLAALNHARLLIEKGHEVSIVGALDSLESMDLPVANRAHVPARGSGSIYSPAQINRDALKKTITYNHPDLLIIEAWQTAITDTAIDIADDLKIPVLMISHGISLHPFSTTIVQWLRALAWVPYRLFKLPSLVKKLSAITTLDEWSLSPRFYDRDLAKKLGIPVVPLKNFPAHAIGSYLPINERLSKILVVGYFSLIKNQLAAIDLLAKLPNHIDCVFVGQREGAYFEKCKKRVAELSLNSRVTFLQDDECDLVQQISQAMLVFAPSMTEALPMTLIEAMACGTPFVASSVGAVSSLSGGILADAKEDQIKVIESLLSKPDLWEKYSIAGRAQYDSEFTEQHIASQLEKAIEIALQYKSGNNANIVIK
jgi:glycosyltransferase involved in cell wall biosynthesis